MKTLQLFLMTAFFLLFAQIGYSQNWQLVWADEFDNGISSDWVFETGNGSGGWGNNELQYYRRENATVQNGRLVITAKRENFNGFNYTSARMKTQGRKNFKFGKIEARIAMPSSMGLWPAFWMLGANINSVSWPSCGEIDIMEHINNAPEIHGTIHWQDHNGNYANYGGSVATNATTFHNYSVEWDATAIRWYLDGTQYHEVNIANGVNGTGEFHNEFFLLLNLAVGGNWPGFNIDNNAFPATMQVEYVRVYQNNGTPPPPSFSTTIQAENYSVMSGIQTESTSDSGGGQNVGWIDQGDWMVYPVNIPSAGTYTVRYRVASLNGGGKIRLDRDAGATIIGDIDVPATGGWQNWTTITQTVSLQAGQQNLGIYALYGGFNLNWIQIESTSSLLQNLTLQEQTASKADDVVSLYPNPVRNKFTISGSQLSPGDAIVITDWIGKEVYEGNLSSREIDVSTLPFGIYTLRIAKGDTIIIRRFIKK